MERRILEQIIEKLDVLTKRMEDYYEKENLRREYLTSEHVVFECRKKYPYKGKAECIRDTGLSKTTVYKYWDGLLLRGEPSSKKESSIVRMGRPSMDFIVATYRQKHPGGSQKECVKETGLNKKTVKKYWDLVFEECAGKEAKEVRKIV